MLILDPSRTQQPSLRRAWPASYFFPWTSSIKTLPRPSLVKRRLLLPRCGHPLILLLVVSRWSWRPRASERRSLSTSSSCWQLLAAPAAAVPGALALAPAAAAAASWLRPVAAVCSSNASAFCHAAPARPEPARTISYLDTHAPSRDPRLPRLSLALFPAFRLPARRRGRCNVSSCGPPSLDNLRSASRISWVALLRIRPGRSRMTQPLPREILCWATPLSLAPCLSSLRSATPRYRLLARRKARVRAPAPCPPRPLVRPAGFPRWTDTWLSSPFSNI